MSTFAQLLASLESSQPVYLYTLGLGSLSYLYTSAEDAIEVGTDIWTPAAISHGPIDRQGSGNRQEVLLTLPSETAIVQLLRDTYPTDAASLSIFVAEPAETPAVTKNLIWIGEVVSTDFTLDGAGSQLTCRALEALAGRSMPTYGCQIQCGHVLYGTRCGVDATSFKHPGIVTAVSGSTITVTGASGFTDGTFKGGKVNFGDERRTVVDHVGDVITLIHPFGGSPLGSSVDVFQGCDHLATGHCSTRFNNVLRHGGMPFAPNTNPYSEGIA